jgi:GTP-binding protein HflX
MVLQRLDAMVTLPLTGEGNVSRGRGAAGFVDQAYISHLLPQSDKADTDPNRLSYWDVSPLVPVQEVMGQDFVDLVEGLEAEFRREYIAQTVDESIDRVLIVGLITQTMDNYEFLDTLTELERLVDTAGGKVVETITQKRSRPDSKTVVGSGKVDDIALKVQTLGVNLVVFDRDLSPMQVRNIEQACGVRVVDRTEVILDIFAQRAQSQAGKLQVELAQLEYMLPRLTGRGQAMSRLGGGIGTRGPGETKLETERRLIQKRLSRLQAEVNQLQAHRSRLRNQRQQEEMFSVAIVGYTNAGKSTLINALTNAEVYTANQLFATLDPTTRRLAINSELSPTKPIQILITDTVGFIHELPPALMDAFRATLEEVTESDLLLHVVDLSHPAWLNQIKAVKEIINGMPIATGPHLMAFNKLDVAPSDHLAEAKEKFPDAVFISASDRLGLDTLRQRLATYWYSDR